MIVTMKSMFTSNTNQMDLDITNDQLDRWQEGGLIQKVFPHLSTEEREFLITGASIEEQEEVFQSEEEMDKEYEVEREWDHDGLACVALSHVAGHRCGYVGVPSEHPLFGLNYDEIYSKFNIDVHGGLTFSGPGNDPDGFPSKREQWFFGFDCAHVGDAKDLTIMNDEYRRAFVTCPMIDRGTIKTTEFVIRECISLANQLIVLR